MATAERDRPHPDGSPAHETRCGTDGTAELGATIIDALAAVEGVDPMDQDLGLYEAVDLEALGELFDDRSDDDWRFEFTVDGYRVVVDGDGRVAVYDR